MPDYNYGTVTSRRNSIIMPDYNNIIVSFSEHTVCPLVLCPKRLVVPNPGPNPVPVVLDVGVPNRLAGF